jgi:anti-sigma regulatory factor (Ser/Thr protein kinase)
MNASQASLEVRLDLNLLPVVTSFGEQVSRSLGLSAAQIHEMTLATEEIFAFLCQSGKKDDQVVVQALDGSYYVELRWLLRSARLDLRTFNITASVNPDDEDSLEDMGLLIAARSVDRFRLSQAADEGIVLSLIKDKHYPEITDAISPPASVTGEIRLIRPDTDELKTFVHYLVASYPSFLYPPSFRFPGKVADMVSGGQFDALIAVDAKGRICGGTLWQYLQQKTVEMFGPYLFPHLPAQDDSEKGMQDRLSGLLLEGCLGRVARTTAIGLICRYLTPFFLADYFEFLGSVDVAVPEGGSRDLPVYYRQIQEDAGCQIWSHPALETFLKEQYKRLVLPREIRLIRPEGETRAAHSVISTHSNREQRQVTMTLAWDGADTTRNLSRHLQLFEKEGLTNVFFAVDLAFPWQTRIVPDLLDRHFTPRLLLPYGGESDLVLFQHKEG